MRSMSLLLIALLAAAPAFAHTTQAVPMTSTLEVAGQMAIRQVLEKNLLLGADARSAVDLARVINGPDSSGIGAGINSFSCVRTRELHQCTVSISIWSVHPVGTAKTKASFDLYVTLQDGAAVAAETGNHVG